MFDFHVSNSLAFILSDNWGGNGALGLSSRIIAAFKGYLFHEANIIKRVTYRNSDAHAMGRARRDFSSLVATVALAKKVFKRRISCSTMHACGMYASYNACYVCVVYQMQNPYAKFMLPVASTRCKCAMLHMDNLRHSIYSVLLFWSRFGGKDLSWLEHRSTSEGMNCNYDPIWFDSSSILQKAP